MHARDHRVGRRRIGAAIAARAPHGFTLLELLVSIAIVAVLLGLVVPGLAMSMKSARGFRCQMSLRSVAFDFAVFADDTLHGDRGDDTAWGNRFRLSTFQESQYGIDEFWRWEGEDTHTVPDESRYDPMRCSEVKGPLTLRRDLPCGKPGAISPPEHVSFGFNARLHRAEVVGADGKVKAVYVMLSQDILSQTDVPLVWDVDGAIAAQNGVEPVYSAPSLDSQGPYAGDLYWYPGLRHNGSANFAFMDGRVESSRRPLDENGWRWGYQPVR